MLPHTSCVGTSSDMSGYGTYVRNIKRSLFRGDNMINVLSWISGLLIGVAMGLVVALRIKNNEIAELKLNED